MQQHTSINSSLLEKLSIYRYFSSLEQSFCDGGNGTNRRGWWASKDSEPELIVAVLQRRLAPATPHSALVALHCLRQLTAPLLQQCLDENLRIFQAYSSAPSSPTCFKIQKNNYLIFFFLPFFLLEFLKMEVKKL